MTEAEAILRMLINESRYCDKVGADTNYEQGYADGINNSIKLANEALEIIRKYN